MTVLHVRATLMDGGLKHDVHACLTGFTCQTWEWMLVNGLCIQIQDVFPMSTVLPNFSPCVHRPLVRRYSLTELTHAKTAWLRHARGD